jgi:hypothetical protein
MAFWDNWRQQPTQQAQPASTGYVNITPQGLQNYQSAMAAGKTYVAGQGYVSPQASPYWHNVVTATPPGGQPQMNPLAGWNPQPAPVAGRPANLYADWLTTPSTGLAGTTVNNTEPLNDVRVVSIGGYDYQQIYDPKTGKWTTDITNTLGRTQDTVSGAMTDYQKAMINYQLQDMAATQGLSEDELALRRQQMYQDAAYQNAQLAWQQQQWSQQQAQEQKNYLANLAAEPHSWLEYASAAGQTPVIQPWMLPLMPSDYGIYSAGQTMPGWNPENMTGIPQLINPSAQYMARIGPTAQQQYYGYEQAKTGATPEESAWRLWSYAPPSGNRGLTQVR